MKIKHGIFECKLNVRLNTKILQEHHKNFLNYDNMGKLVYLVGQRVSGRRDNPITATTYNAVA